MTDRELLELAAKAEGRAIKYMHVVDGYGKQVGEEWIASWNPLTDDGDALRLAVTLFISIEHPNPADIGGEFVTVRICKHRYRYLFLKKTCFTVTQGSEDCPGNLGAATRLAIVRAAAEIGGKHD